MVKTEQSFNMQSLYCFNIETRYKIVAVLHFISSDKTRLAIRADKAEIVIVSTVLIILIYNFQQITLPGKTI